MKNKTINIIAFTVIIFLTISAYFLLGDLKMFLACLCVLGIEKSLDYLYIRKNNE